jgi:hypothetical protein
VRICFALKQFGSRLATVVAKEQLFFVTKRPEGAGRRIV